MEVNIIFLQPMMNKYLYRNYFIQNMLLFLNNFATMKLLLFIYIDDRFYNNSQNIKTNTLAL